MFSASVASSLFSTVTSALGSKAAASLTSQSGTQPFGATQSGSAVVPVQQSDGNDQSVPEPFRGHAILAYAEPVDQRHADAPSSRLLRRTADRGPIQHRRSADPTATTASATGTGTA